MLGDSLGTHLPSGVGGEGKVRLNRQVFNALGKCYHHLRPERAATHGKYDHRTTNRRTPVRPSPARNRST